MSEELERRVQALEHVLTSELPAEVRTTWPEGGQTFQTQLLSGDPRNLIRLLAWQAPWGLQLTLEVNYVVVWRREVRFQA